MPIYEGRVGGGVDRHREDSMAEEGCRKVLRRHDERGKVQRGTEKTL